MKNKKRITFTDFSTYNKPCMSTLIKNGKIYELFHTHIRSEYKCEINEDIFLSYLIDKIICSKIIIDNLIKDKKQLLKERVAELEHFLKKEKELMDSLSAYQIAAELRSNNSRIRTFTYLGCSCGDTVNDIKMFKKIKVKNNLVVIKQLKERKK